MVAKDLESFKIVSTDDYAMPKGFELNVAFRGFVDVRYQNNGGVMRIPFGEHEGRFYLANFVRAGALAK